jgi:tetratricopeptide (TPR) repeat protein
MRTLRIRAFVAAAAVFGSVTAAAADQDSLAAARDLYAAAAYEDALATLNRLHPADRPAIEARAIEQYRAMCLLALGRGVEAEQAIQAVIQHDPTYQPTDVSPRVRTAFSEVRRRVLPGVVEQRYAAAKTAYDRKDFAAAASGFGEVLALLADPDVAPAAGQPPLSDLKTLASGFRDLAVAAATPPPVPAAPPVPVAQRQVVIPARPDPARIYGPSDANVVPPVAVRQELPPFPGPVPAAMQGAMDIIIDETGAVVSATMSARVSAAYDAHALAAARTWRYRPATLNGTPVKYRKTIQIAVKASR